MFINNWKHLAVAGLMASAFFCGAGAWQPAPAEAAPIINIDYSGDTYWAVDKGSVNGNGAPSAPIHVWVEQKEGDSEVNTISARYYSFVQENGNWKFRYYGYTGKGGKIPYTRWRNVSGDQLANDILYIALN